MKIGTTSKTSEILNKYNLTPKKKFGQNFLVDSNTLYNIINLANVSKEDFVIEIGAGIGALTQMLCEKAKFVYSFEIDDDLIDYLSTNLAYDNLEFIFEDFLKYDLEAKFNTMNLKVVANLPYYITTPILFKILESNVAIDELYVMMQKEVGDRISANPNSRDYNALSVILQVNYQISTGLKISRNVFNPKPNVDSVVMKLVRHNIYSINDYDFFTKFVHDCFKFKRKNLRNNLKAYDLELLDLLLKANGFDLNSRAEQLPIEIFVLITNEYRRKKL